jgi:cell division protein FtsN
MKTVYCIAILTFSVTFTTAQQGSVKIQQDTKIANLLDIYKDYISESEFYRIQVGFGSYAKAERIKAEVEIDFPNMSSKIDFDSPTYRVRVGRFKTKLEAERKFKEVREKYPDAMLLKPKKST